MLLLNVIKDLFHGNIQYANTKKQWLINSGPIILCSPIHRFLLNLNNSLNINQWILQCKQKNRIGKYVMNKLRSTLAEITCTASNTISNFSNDANINGNNLNRSSQTNAFNEGSNTIHNNPNHVNMNNLVPQIYHQQPDTFNIFQNNTIRTMPIISNAIPIIHYNNNNNNILHNNNANYVHYSTMQTMRGMLKQTLCF